ncbi:MAG: hypothetical protein O3C21_15715 [Verrucomicrobia bacterium]|nr:hypothetical protein [Verrucomicrobiota bacterium]
MELHEFVRETLSQIIKGISEAQNSEAITKSTAAIVPVGQGIDDDKNLNQEVQFDIAVTAQSGTETKGGVGIFVGPVTLGSAGKSQQSTDSMNRIKFAVPVYLPAQKIRRTQE